MPKLGPLFLPCQDPKQKNIKNKKRKKQRRKKKTLIVFFEKIKEANQTKKNLRREMEEMK